MHRALVTCCTGGEGIMPEVVASLIRIANDYACDIVLPVDRPYECALNRAAKCFRESNCSYWLNIDSDNPPTTNPLHWMAKNPDVVCFPTPIYYADRDGKLGIRWNHWIRNGVQIAGSGCLLIARRVIERIGVPFVRHVDDDGLPTKGPDFVFSEAVDYYGFKIEIAYDEPCHHFTKVDLLQCLTQYIDRSSSAVPEAAEQASSVSD